MTATLTIQPRFRGPEESANGGYVGGLMARGVDGAFEITLRRPVPLNRPLTVHHLPETRRTLQDGDTLLASGRPAFLALETPQPVSFEAAVSASRAYLGFEHHPYPSCFVCGIDREQPDGMRLFAGPVPGAGITAAPWTPHSSLAGTDGYIRDEFVWAALDCPGAFAVVDGPEHAVVLGRITVRIESRIRPDDRCVVMGWKIAAEGRKRAAGTVLVNRAGSVVGFARAIWITVASSDVV